MENYKIVSDYLENYNEDELFYKSCYELRDAPEAVRQLIEQTGIDRIRERRLILPAWNSLPPQLNAPKNNLSETDIFIHEMRDRDAYLTKHNRFSPAYLHSHNYFEMFYVMKGQCRQQLAGEYMTLKTGDLCFIAPQTSHALEVFDDSIIINIFIRTSTFDDIFFHVLRNKDILSLFFMNHLYHTHRLDYMIFHTDRDEEIYHGILTMFLEQMETDQYTNRIISNLLSIFFLKLVRRYSKTATLPKAHKISNPALPGIISYIYDHYQSVTLNSLAEQFHFTPAYCSRLIKNDTGQNFKDLLKDIRLKKAENMLITTNMKIAGISEHLGYENKESFIRLFKQNYGMSPGAYRNFHSKTASLP